MKSLQGYRYFLGIRLAPQCYPFFRRIGAALGCPIRLDLLHLTLCVVAEVAERDPYMLRRIQTALGGLQLHSFPVNLSRVIAGPQGARARTFGRQDEIQDFYLELVRLLRVWGLEPLHRKSGLHPHVTLTHVPQPPALLKIAIRWFPTELHLVESEVGLTRHNTLGRWPLLPPRQPQLPLRGVVALSQPTERRAGQM
jgi:RNA 2',3'-cyclic 3'-phosphodiesterase